MLSDILPGAWDGIRLMSRSSKHDLELETVLRHVAKGERQIERQHQIIAELKANARDTTSAEKVLNQLERSHEKHLERLDRLEAEHD